jgi:hypothetical protein
MLVMCRRNVARATVWPEEVKLAVYLEDDAVNADRLMTACPTASAMSLVRFHRHRTQVTAVRLAEVHVPKDLPGKVKVPTESTSGRNAQNADCSRLALACG